MYEQPIIMIVGRLKPLCGSPDGCGDPPKPGLPGLPMLVYRWRRTMKVRKPFIIVVNK